MLDEHHSFPAPMPSEHLLSCLMRYAISEGRKEYVKAAKTVSLNVSNVTNKCYWQPIYTDVITQYQGRFHSAIAKENTLLNVYAKFSDSIFDNLLEEQISKPSKLQFKYRSISQATPGWKWCRICVIEDEEKYGCAYWHRDHQFAMKLRCDKHCEPLYSQCKHCGYEYLSVLQGPPPQGFCVKCGFIFKRQRSTNQEFDVWLENCVHEILNNELEINIQELKGKLHERYGFDTLKRSWSLAERKKITFQQQAFARWLNTLNLTRYLAPQKNNKPYSEHPSFNMSSFAFNPYYLPPLVILLFSRYLEEVRC